MDTQLYLKNVVSLELESSKCTGCGVCTQVCPHAVFILVNKKASIEKLDKCMECGACMINCRDKAIRVNKGVGCASAVIYGFLNKTEPNCDCSDKGGC